MARNFYIDAKLRVVADAPSIEKAINSITNRFANIKPVSIKLIIDKGSASSADNLTARISTLRKEIRLLTRNTESANAALTSLSAHLGMAGKGTTTAHQEFAKGASTLNRMGKEAHHAASAAENFGKSVGLALKRQTAFVAGTTAIFALVGATTLAIRDAIQFEKEMVKVAQVSNTTVASLGGLNKTIRELSTSLGVSSDDLTIAAQTLAQAELSVTETRLALEALAKSDLAPTFDSIEETTEGLIATMKQFKVPAEDFEEILGSMNAVSAQFAVESADLVTAIKRAGASFAQAGVSAGKGPKELLAEFLGLFTAIRSTTRESAETIGTGLRTIVARIQRPDTIAFLKEYGVNLENAEGKFVGAFEAFQRLSQVLSDPALQGTSRLAAVTEELGGFRQLQKVIPLLNEFATANAAVGVAIAGQDSLTESLATAQSSLANQLAQVREEFKKLIADLVLSDSFKIVAKGVLFLTKNLIQLVDTFKSVIPVFLAIGVGKLLPSVGKFFTGFKNTFKHVGDLREAIVDKIPNLPEKIAIERKENTSALSANTSALGQLTAALRIANGNRALTVLTPSFVPKIGKASGGIVPGTGTGDKIPALLTPKEFVIKQDSARKLGAANLAYMNRTGKLPRFARGGWVGLARGGNPDDDFLRDVEQNPVSFDKLLKSAEALDQALENLIKPITQVAQAIEPAVIKKSQAISSRGLLGLATRGEGASQLNPPDDFVPLSSLAATDTQKKFAEDAKAFAIKIGQMLGMAASEIEASVDQNLIIERKENSPAFVRALRSGKSGIGVNPDFINPEALTPQRISSVARHEGVHLADLALGAAPFSAGGPNNTASSETAGSILSRVADIARKILPVSTNEKYNEPRELVARLAEIPGRLEAVISAVQANRMNPLDPQEFYRNFRAASAPITTTNITLPNIGDTLHQLADDLLKSGMNLEEVLKRLAIEYEKISTPLSKGPPISESEAARQIQNATVIRSSDFDKSNPNRNDLFGKALGRPSTLGINVGEAIFSDVGATADEAARHIKKLTNSSRITDASLNVYYKAINKGKSAQDAYNTAVKFATRAHQQLPASSKFLAKIGLPTLANLSGGPDGSPIGRISQKIGGGIGNARNFLNSGAGFGALAAGGIIGQGLINAQTNEVSRAGASGIVSTVGSVVGGFAAGGPVGALVAGLAAGASAISAYNEAVNHAARSKVFSELDGNLKKFSESLSRNSVVSAEFAEANEGRQRSVKASQDIITEQSELGVFQRSFSSLTGAGDAFRTGKTGEGISNLVTGGAEESVKLVAGGFGVDLGGESREERTIKGRNFLERLKDPEFATRNEQNAEFVKTLLERNVATRRGATTGISEEDFFSLGLTDSTRTASLQKSLDSGQLDPEGFTAAVTLIGKDLAETQRLMLEKHQAEVRARQQLNNEIKLSVSLIRESTTAFQLQSQSIERLLGASELSANLATSGKASVAQLQFGDIKSLLGTRAGQERLSEIAGIVGAGADPTQQKILSDALGLNDRFLNFKDRVGVLAQDETSSAEAIRVQLERELKTLVGDSLGEGVDLTKLIDGIIKESGGEENIFAALSDPDVFSKAFGPLKETLDDTLGGTVDLVAKNANQLGQVLANLTQITNQNNILLEKQFSIGRKGFELGIRSIFGNINPLLFASGEGLINFQRSSLALRTGGLNSQAVSAGDIGSLRAFALESQTRLEAANRFIQQGGTGSVGIGGRTFGKGTDASFSFGGVRFAQTQESLGTSLTDVTTQTQLLADQTSKAREQLQFFADGLEGVELESFREALLGEQQRLAGIGETVFFGDRQSRKDLSLALGVEDRVLAEGASAFDSLSRREKKALQQFRGNLDPQVQEALNQFLSQTAQNFGAESPLGDVNQELVHVNNLLIEVNRRQSEATEALIAINSSLAENIKAAFPEFISIQGQHTVDVRLNGLEVMQALNAQTEKIIMDAVIAELDSRGVPRAQT